MTPKSYHKIDLSFNFPFGKAPLLMLIILIICSVWLFFNPVNRRESTLDYWTFTHISYESNEPAIREFEKNHPGVTVDLQLVHLTAVTTRLRAAFWADLDIPDMVEVEISRAGSFFRGPLEDVPFIDLRPYLERDGLYDIMVPTRFSPYTNRGKLFGLPLDLHPVMLAYRRDLVEELGIDVEELKTWDDFVRVGREVTIPDQRYMLQMSDTTQGHLEMLLFQRGGGYFDKDGNLTMNSELAVDTLKYYIRMIAGPNKIATDLGSGAVFTQMVEQGYFLFYVAPDWMTYVIQNDVPSVSGKMALTPLPAWEPGGRRTSTLGGTMMAITKDCDRPELAWELAKRLYFNENKLAERYRASNIIPPVRQFWKNPVYSEPREYWSGQPIGKLYADLAEEVPPQYSSPFIELAKNKMNEAMAACAAYYRSHQEEGFDEYARRRLDQAAEEVKHFMRRSEFE